MNILLQNIVKMSAEFLNYVILFQKYTLLKIFSKLSNHSTGFKNNVYMNTVLVIFEHTIDDIMVRIKRQLQLLKKKSSNHLNFAIIFLAQFVKKFYLC